MKRPQHVPTLLLALFLSVAISSALAQEYTFGQATWYDSIYNGFCGFGRDIPEFVGALPFIETNRNGAGFWQPPATNACSDLCYEVSCVPQFVESSNGEIYLDRRDACADQNKAIVIKIVDECRCSLPQFPGGPKGNFLWCCNTPTRRLRIDRHIDLSKQAFSALAKDGNFNIGIMGIRWRQVSCSRTTPGTIVTLPMPPPMPSSPNMTQGVPGQPSVPPHSAMPPNVTMHNVASSNKVPLPEYLQCGGKGGLCALFGECVDRIWSTRSCAAGLTCKRQNEWYYQCLKSTTTPPTTKVLSKWQQCGGIGGACKSSATGSKCVDDPFPGTSCASDLKCARQSAYYWQCLERSAPVTPKPTPTATCKKFVPQGQQCGGKGAQCEFDLGVCADRPAPGVCCEPGYSCVAQNEWYWGCKKN